MKASYVTGTDGEEPAPQVAEPVDTEGDASH